MRPELKRLIELQTVDLRLIEVRAALAELPQRRAEIENRVEAARAQLARAREALITTLKERKKYELDIEQWKEKARRYKDQVYEVKTNEAYKALQHEIQMAEAEIAKAEDRLLEQMIAGEETERQVKTSEKSLVEVEAAAAADRQKIEAEQQAAETELAALTAERAEAVAGVSEDLLDLYQRIARKHGGIALAEVREETCTVCRVRVRPHVYQELRREECEEIFHCESCTRILYCAEPSAAQAPMASGQAQGN